MNVVAFQTTSWITQSPPCIHKYPPAVPHWDIIRRYNIIHFLMESKYAGDKKR